VLAQRLKEEEFVELPGGAGRVSVWDLWNYVKNNPELEALANRDPAFAAPAQGMTRWGPALQGWCRTFWNRCTAVRMTDAARVSAGFGSA
jgi:hypothetical protein